MPCDKGITRLAYATALVRHAFPEEPKETHAAFIHGIMHGEKFHVGDHFLGTAAVEVMDPQHKAEFEHVFDSVARAAEETKDEEHSAGEDIPAQKGKRGESCRGRGRGRRGGRGRGRKRQSRHGADREAPSAPEPLPQEPETAFVDVVG